MRLAPVRAFHGPGCRVRRPAVAIRREPRGNAQFGRGFGRLRGQAGCEEGNECEAHGVTAIVARRSAGMQAVVNCLGLGAADTGGTSSRL